MGSFFTWSNGRTNHHRIEKRLDRAITNNLWIDNGNFLSDSTLVKTIYDHFPLLPNLNHFELQYVAPFKFLRI